MGGATVLIGSPSPYPVVLAGGLRVHLASAPWVRRAFLIQWIDRLDPGGPTLLVALDGSWPAAAVQWGDVRALVSSLFAGRFEVIDLQDAAWSKLLRELDLDFVPFFEA